MKTLSILIIFCSCFSQSLDIDKIRAEILLSINDDRKSIYINSIFDETKLISELKNIPQSVLIARACLYTKFGKKVSESEFCELSSMATEIVSFAQSKREFQMIRKYKFYLLDQNA